MKLTYAFVFYFLSLMIGVTVLLAFLYFKPIRHAIFKLSNKLNLTNTPAFKLIFWITFSIIGVVFIDSLLSLHSVNKTMTSNIFLIQILTYKMSIIMSLLNPIKEIIIWLFILNWGNSIWLKETLCSLHLPFLFFLSLTDS